MATSSFHCIMANVLISRSVSVYEFDELLNEISYHIAWLRQISQIERNIAYVEICYKSIFFTMVPMLAI